MSHNSSPRWDDFSDASDAWLSPEPDRDGPGHPGKLPLGLAQTVLDDGFPYECGRQRVRPAPRLVAGGAPQLATRERTGSSATFEDLPSEIARMILRENVVLPQVGDWYELNDEQWRERRDELLSYSLVSPVLREESRREMLRFVHVVGEDGLRLLRWSLAQGGDTRARFVRIFTFARPEGLPRDLVRDATAHDVLAGVLPGLPALRQLSLDGTRLDIDTLANLPELSHLMLHETEFGDTENRDVVDWSFPRLRALRCTRIDFDSTAAALKLFASLPALAYLELYPAALPLPHWMTTLIPPLAPQLTHLSTDEDAFELFEDATAVKILSFSIISSDFVVRLRDSSLRPLHLQGRYCPRATVFSLSSLVGSGFASTLRGIFVASSFGRYEDIQALKLDLERQEILLEHAGDGGPGFAVWAALMDERIKSRSMVEVVEPTVEP